jgi:hypothetical protein
MKETIFLTILFVMTAITCSAQDWMKLVSLESTREEVEKILGKPEQSFPTYALYKVGGNKFSVWYSSGECRKDTEGRQYKVPANLMTQLSVRLNIGPSIKSAVPDLSKYTKEGPSSFGRYLYISKDESIVYETFGDAQEMVNSITIGPSKAKKSFLCKNEDLK